MSVVPQGRCSGKERSKNSVNDNFCQCCTKMSPFILRNVISCTPDDSVACTASSSLPEVFIYFGIRAGVLLGIIK